MTMVRAAAVCATDEENRNDQKGEKGKGAEGGEWHCH